MAEELEYKKVAETINDFANDNLSKLAQLFPAAVKDGEVDFEALKQELGDFNEVGSEKYELTWAGKQNAKKVALEDVNGKTLNYVPEDSKNPDTTENLYIEGDNLEVLKLLRQNYYGAIKMIYIDPPYNTGNDFVYNDNFTMRVEESELAEGNRDELGEKYKQNSKSQNRYHANWLNMMYPRLKVAKDLLMKEGVIFISIDENEIDNLKKITNEIFGETNFIGEIIIKSNPRGSQSTQEIASLHEYLLVYAMDINYTNIVGHKLSDEMISEYKYEELGEKYRLLGLRQRGGFWRRIERPNLFYPIYVNPANGTLSTVGDQNYTDIVYPIQPSTNEDGTWRWSKEKIFKDGDQLVAKKVTRNSTEVWDIFQKDFLSVDDEVKRTKAKSIWDEKEINYQNGTVELKNLIGSGIFDYAKPVYLIKRALEMVGMNEGELILDFFSGSATTASAVMEYNSENNKMLRFLLIQIEEQINQRKIKNEELNTICDIGKERIRRAGNKILEEKPELTGKLDIGFKVFKVADTNIKWNHQTKIDEQFTVDTAVYTPDLMDFMPGAKDEDIVYEVMLRQNDVPLSSTLETLSEIGQRTYLYASSYLVCLETEITVALVDKLAALNPLPFKFIFRDSAFQDDIALKDETFRRLKALIEKNAGTSKKTYTVEFI